MAKICACCKKKIGFTEGSFRLNNTAGYFCLSCSGEAKAMLKPILDLPDKEKYSKLCEIKNDFAEALAESSYGKDAKDALKEEFMLIYKEKIKNPQAETRFFRADFKESLDVIMNAGERISSSGDIRKSNVVRLGDTEDMTVVFEQYFFRIDSYASLTVNLTCSGGVSAVTAIGAGGGDDFFNFDFGANSDYARDFWREIKNFSSAWMEKEIEDPGEYLFFESAEHKNAECKDAECKGAEHEIGENRGGVKTPALKRIGVLGGSFDPVHMGHKALAEAAVSEAALDLLIIMPAKVQPFKQGMNVAGERDREAMAKLAFSDCGKTVVSSYELNNTAALSYTVRTLGHLQSEYPGTELFFISGTDSYLSMETWYRGKEILRKFNFIVSSRPGYREDELKAKMDEYKEKYGAETIKLRAEMPDISSTSVRERLRASKSVSGLVPEPVERYIEENGLYK